MRKISKVVLSVSAAAVIAAATAAPVIVNAWTDTNNTRPEYTNAQIESGALGNKITFNSIKDSKIGHEKNFVGAKVAGANVTNWNADVINVEDGGEYTIRMYVHNNSPKAEEGMARDVKATFEVPDPKRVANQFNIVGNLYSSNAEPNGYRDMVTLKSSENFWVEYVKGSAQYNNKDQKGNERSFALSDEVIHSGVLVGYDKMDGNIPGCYGYSGVVTINVKVHKSVAAEVTKQVRIKGTKTWSESVNAKVGDEVEYQIKYTNLLKEQVKNVMIRDVLPTNVEYVENSTYLYNSNYKDGVLLKDNTLTTTGINIGTYDSQGNAWVRFTGKVVDKTMACGDNQLVNWASATVSGSSIENAVYKDDASVMVNKDDETCKTNPTPTPTPTPDNPGTTPTTIVSTGPETIVTGAVGAGAVMTTLGYYIASRKKLL